MAKPSLTPDFLYKRGFSFQSTFLCMPRLSWLSSLYSCLSSRHMHYRECRRLRSRNRCYNRHVESDQQEAVSLPLAYKCSTRTKEDLHLRRKPFSFPPILHYASGRNPISHLLFHTYRQRSSFSQKPSRNKVAVLSSIALSVPNDGYKYTHPK